MDWYYPVLGGALTGAEATERIEDGWDRFVVPGLGVRCVVPNPWVTGGESCELALALWAVGESDRALEILQSIQHLRDAGVRPVLDGLRLRRRRHLAPGTHHLGPPAPCSSPWPPSAATRRHGRRLQRRPPAPRAGPRLLRLSGVGPSGPLRVLPGQRCRRPAMAWPMNR